MRLREIQENLGKTGELLDFWITVGTFFWWPPSSFNDELYEYRVL